MAKVSKDVIYTASFDGRKAEQGFARMDKRVKSSVESVKEFGVAMLKVSVGVAAVGFAMKKVFDVARGGAQVQQLTESFNRMATSVFKMPDLLNEMRAAVRGTVADATLMSGILTLSAGASDELAQALAGQSAKLLEIAKASSKLNPLLGDTSFLFQSIATGIKRSSPLILDNLGLVISIGEANEKYAESLGKTAKQLTKADQQLALLNATISAGDVLIKQVGGSVDALTDSYDRFTTKLLNTWDALKSGLDEVVKPVISGFNDMDDAMGRALETSQDNGFLRFGVNLVAWNRALTDMSGALQNMLFTAQELARFAIFGDISGLAPAVNIPPPRPAIEIDDSFEDILLDDQDISRFDKAKKSMEDLISLLREGRALTGRPQERSERQERLFSVFEFDEEGEAIRRMLDPIPEVFEKVEFESIGFLEEFQSKFMGMAVNMELALTAVFAESINTGIKLLDTFIAQLASGLLTFGLGSLFSGIPVLSTIFPAASVDDALITNKGEVIKLNPNDNVLAFQGSTPPGTGGNQTFIFQLDGREIGRHMVNTSGRNRRMRAI